MQPDPRVARRLQKIADHVRVKLARTPSQPMTAELFGSLWHMGRTEPNHYLDARNWTGGTRTFRKARGGTAAQLISPNQQTPSHQDVINDPTVLHFVAHHPDQIAAPEFPTSNSELPTFAYHMRNFPNDPTYSSAYFTDFDEVNPNYDHEQMRRGAVEGNSRVAGLLGIPPRKFANESHPTVFFKSHRSAKLAAMLTGGHVETVAFNPKQLAKDIATTQIPREQRSRSDLRTLLVGYNTPLAYDLRNRQMTGDEVFRANNMDLSPNVIMRHPVFGEYLTKFDGENGSSTNAGDYDWIDTRNTHRRVSLEGNSYHPNEDVIAGYGHPPLHFAPEILDDVGRELHAQVVANPGDHLARAVLADHLDSMGHHEHADNWRQTLPLKFRKSGAPVRYAAEQDEPSYITQPSDKPSSISFGDAKSWTQKNDPHEMWHHFRSAIDYPEGPVRHLTHESAEPSAVHFISGHPAQVSPICIADPTDERPYITVLSAGIVAGDRRELARSIPVCGVNPRTFMNPSGIPQRAFGYSTAPAPKLTENERSIVNDVGNAALETNQRVLESLGMPRYSKIVNGIDAGSAFTPLFKDRSAAERIADQIGGYVHTTHIDRSRLLGRKNAARFLPEIGFDGRPLTDRNHFAVIDIRKNNRNPGNDHLDTSLVTLANHPDYGEYLLTHNINQLTKEYYIGSHGTHFTGSLNKLELSENNPDHPSAHLLRNEKHSSILSPIISQYWRNLIDLHSIANGSAPLNDQYDMPYLFNNHGIDYTPPTRQLINSMGDAAQHLYAMALADRNDHMPRMVLADMFDEHGHDGAANFMRASIPHHVRRQLKLAKGEKPGDVFHTLVWHNSETDEPISQFDASKASKTALLGPAFYFSKQPKRWNLPGSKGIDRPYLVGGNLIDLSKPLEPEHAQAIASALGRNSEAPLLALEHKFGSVSKGLEAAGFDGAWHLGPSGKTNVIDLAMFKPHLIKPAPQSDDGQFDRVKLAKGEKPSANLQPKSVAQQQISPETASKPSGGMDETSRQISDLLAWPGESRQQPEQPARSKDFSDNPPEAGDVIRIDSSLSGDRFHNGTYRVTPDHRGEIWHTNGREISVEPVGNSPVNPSGFIPVRGRNYFMVNQAERQAPEPAEEQQQQQFPAPLAPLRHPEISPRLSFEDNAHKLESGDIIHTYFNYVDENGKSHTRLLHSQPRIFDRIDHEGGVFYSRRVHDDGSAGSVILAAPSTAEHETPTFALIQRAQTTRDRQEAGLPSLAEPNNPAPRQLTPEQMAEAHFSANDPVLVRSDDGTVNNGVYSHPYFDPESGRLMHAVDMSVTGSRKGVAPESVWHRRGYSSASHPAFTGPQNWSQISTLDQSINGARSGSRVWVNTANPRVGLMSPTTEQLDNYRRATVLGRNPDRNSLSVRLDGGEDPIEVHHGRVRLDLSPYGQFPAHVDAFPGSPVSVVDSASGRVYHGLYRGSSPTSSEAGVSHLASLRDAGANESWLDPSRSNEQHAHLVDIQDEHGPLTVAVERSDLLPRFARGVMHDWSAEHPQSSARTLNMVADSIERDQPDLANRMRENASRLSGMPNPITVTPVQAGLPPAAPAQPASRAQSSASAKSSQTPAGAPPVEKKLERIIFNAGERNYDDVAESLRGKFREIFGEDVDDQTIMDILRVPRAFPGADPNHPAFSPENLSLDLSIYSDSVGSTVRSKLPDYKFYASTSVGSGDTSNRSQGHSGMRGTHDKFISTPHILQNQANAAHKLGISKLDVNAALTNPVINPHDGYTGGIVWPTYGYTKDLERISDWDDDQLAEAIAIARRNNPDLHAIGDNELTLNHLLDSKEGNDWYTQNEPHTYGGKNYLNATSGHMVFHTDPNSISHRILARKVRRLEQNAASRSSPS